MKEEILERASHYALGDNESILRSNEIRAKSPILFVIIGNQVKESIKVIQSELSQKVMNAEGAVYLYIGLERYQEEGTFSLTLPLNIGDEKTCRGNLSRRLLEEEEALKALNEEINKVREAILEKGKMFQYWEQIQVSVITDASEMVNVLLPDIVVLLKKKLEQDFKQVAVDLFALLEETMYTPLQQAMSISFFKEAQSYQKRDYCYEKSIELLEDGLRLNTVYNAPLFNLTFILSDKKENGQKIEGARVKHYETIAAFNLLKNKDQKEVELAEAREQYNNSTFMSNIISSDEHCWASASLAKVKKPKVGIYLATAYHLFRAYKKELNYDGIKGSKALLEAVGLDETKLTYLVNHILPQEESLNEIYSVISKSVSFKELRGLSLQDAEKALYQKTLEDFFATNFIKKSEKQLTETATKEKIKKQIYREVVNHPNYGPYALEELFKIEQIKAIEKLSEQYNYEIKQIEVILQEKESRCVGEVIGSKFGLFDKKYLRDVKGYLINEIYTLKYERWQKKLKLKAIEAIREVLEEIYNETKVELKKLEEVEHFLGILVEEANKFEEAYLVQNVNEYYEKLVYNKLEELKKVKGEHFLVEEKGIGNMTSVLSQSQEVLLEKLFAFQEKYILEDEKRFGLSFEEELLARANMLVTYEEKDIAAKSELYHMLYLSLEENSKPCVYLESTTSRHRYQEKYFFGDRKSEFMVYAYEKDKTSRSYKLGYINDQRKSSLEKLQLMGGFSTSDLIYTRTAQRYYDAYVKEGYVFLKDEEISTKGD